MLGPQLEDVADLDAAHDLQPPFAIRARVAGDDLAQIGDLRRLGKVPAEVDPGQVEPLFVRPAHEIAHRGDGAVGDHLDVLRPDRADVAPLALQGGLDFRVGGKAERADQLLRLELVQVVVAAQQQEMQDVVVHHRDGLYGLLQIHFQKLCDVLAFRLAGGRYFFQLYGGSFSRIGGNSLGQFHVGGVVRLRAPGDGVLARFGEDVEFVRAGAADRAGVGGDGAELQAEAGEDARVRVVHIAVLALEVGGIDMEGIAVLHDEFAPAQDAEAGTALVAELGLDLVEVLRQRAVALQLAARQVGDGLLGGRLQHEVAQRAEELPHAAAALLPDPDQVPRR